MLVSTSISEFKRGHGWSCKAMLGQELEGLTRSCPGMAYVVSRLSQHCAYPRPQSSYVSLSQCVIMCDLGLV